MSSQFSLYEAFEVIDQNALYHNLQVIRKALAPQVEIAAVLKADAYGHGLEQLVKWYYQWGVRYVCLGRWSEILQIPKDINVEILFLGLLDVQYWDILRKKSIQLWCSDLFYLKKLDLWACKNKTKVKVHLEWDTGMGRLGLECSQCDWIIEQIKTLKHIQVLGLCTHFAYSSDFSSRQWQKLRFEIIVKQFLEDPYFDIQWIHCANSEAIFQDQNSQYTMVRPGLSLYGYPQKYGLTPAMSLYAPVLQCRWHKYGENISYGKNLLKESGYVSVIPLGYADGLQSSWVQSVQPTCQKQKLVFCPPINMDYSMLWSARPIKLGSMVEIIGEDSGYLEGWDKSNLLYGKNLEYQALCAFNNKRIVKYYQNHNK